MQESGIYYDIEETISLVAREPPHCCETTENKVLPDQIELLITKTSLLTGRDLTRIDRINAPFRLTWTGGAQRNMIQFFDKLKC
jgi:hypothetical protein